MSSKNNKQKRNIKIIKNIGWTNSLGNNVVYGGLLIHDDNGIWVIKKKYNKNHNRYDEIQGKYKYMDGNIHKTIARSFSESLYNSCEITCKDVETFAAITPALYLKNQNYTSVWYIIHDYVLKRLTGAVIDSDNFQFMRKATLESNKDSHNLYECNDIVYIHYTKLYNMLNNDKGIKLCNNLKYIIKNGVISYYKNDKVSISIMDIIKPKQK